MRPEDYLDAVLFHDLDVEAVKMSMMGRSKDTARRELEDKATQFVLSNPGPLGITGPGDPAIDHLNEVALGMVDDIVGSYWKE